MKKGCRRALFFSALLMFVAAAPVVVLYALGYRTALGIADPIPVSVLLIETEPTRAKVYVNEEYIGLTPHSLANIRVDSVSVTLTKENYTSWHKQVRMSPGRATELRDVRLFPKHLQASLVVADVRSFSLSPNRRLLAVIHQNNTLAVYDQTGEAVTPPQTFRAKIQSVLWSPNSDAILVKTAGTIPFWYTSVAHTSTLTPVAALGGASSVVWDPRIPGRLLYLNQAHTLQIYHLASRAKIPLISGVEAFATSANHIYALGPAAGKLDEYTLQGQPTGVSLPLPTGAVREVVVTPQENIALGLENGEVWVIAEPGAFSHVASGMHTLAWSPSGKILLLADDTSLHVFNVDDRRATLPLHELRLVQRLSRPIITPQWFAGSRHLIYQVDDEIWIVETDTRDHPISYQVDTTNTGQAQATVGEEGEQLFYLKRGSSGTALVAAPLLVP